MISAILIYGKRGEILSSRVYKDGLRRAVTDAFRAQVISSPDMQSPLLTLGSTSFLHVRHNGMFVVAVTRHDVDGIAVFEFLYRLCEVVTAQLGTFDEACCYRFVAQIYAILDELVDFGFPQNTEVGTLRLPTVDPDSPKLLGSSSTGANTGGVTGGVGAVAGGVSAVGSGMVNSLKRTLTKSNGHNSGSTGVTPPPGTEDVPWRRSNVKHRRNEVYLDVIEKLNAVFDKNGKVLSASADGVLKVKAQLSGLPRCQVELGRSEVLESSQLHACVDHAQFHATGAVQFVPPEGEFELLRYCSTHGIHVPLHVQTSQSDGELVVRIKNVLNEKIIMNIVVLVPLPPNSTSLTQRTKASSGKAKLAPEKTALEWKISRLSPRSEAQLRISADSNLGNDGPVLVTFAIDMYTCSRLNVRSLQVVESSRYSTLKWVRYLTESGAVEMRVR